MLPLPLPLIVPIKLASSTFLHLYPHAWLSRSLKPPPASLRNYPDELCISFTVSYETVKLHLVEVQDLHRELNFPLKLIEMHRLQKVLTGIKRLTPTKRLDRFPITLTVLHSIHFYLKPELSHNLNHVMLWATFTLAFFGLLRYSEFFCNGPFDPSVHLTCNNIKLLLNSHSPSHMLVQVKQSKTDPSRQGHTITIAKSSSPIC